MKSPTNAILTGLAVADFLVMLIYIPYGYYLIQSYSLVSRYTYGWALYVMFYALFTQMLHSVSIWLTVMLAVWRYIALARPQCNRIWNNMRITLATIISSYIVCSVLVIPLYFLFHIIPVETQVDTNGNKANSTTISLLNVTLYRMRDIPEKRVLMNFNLWFYSIIIKLVPCIALTILSLRLIRVLLEAKKRRKQLCNSNNLKPMINRKAGDQFNYGRKTSTPDKEKEKERQTDRTTRMLLAVLLLFLITEFPQGILALLSGLLGQEFFVNCYQKLGNLNFIFSVLDASFHCQILRGSFCLSLNFGFHDY